MAHQVLTSPSAFQVRNPEPELNLLLKSEINESLWQSIARQVRERLYPEKLPPLHLTSKPVPVREIWGAYNYKKRGAVGSTIVHLLIIGGVIAASVVGARVVKQVTKQESVQLIAPDISQYMPMSSKKNDTIGGGGGGGDRDKLQAPKGRLPKFAMEQIAPKSDRSHVVL